MIEACVWNPRPFKLVYTSNDTELFSRVDAIRVKQPRAQATGKEFQVKHVLLPRSPEIETPNADP